MVAKLYRWDEVVVLGVVHHLTAPKVAEQHVEVGFEKLNHSETVEMEVSCLLAKHDL